MIENFHKGKVQYGFATRKYDAHIKIFLIHWVFIIEIKAINTNFIKL